MKIENKFITFENTKGQGAKETNGKESNGKESNGKESKAKDDKGFKKYTMKIRGKDKNVNACILSYFKKVRDDYAHLSACSLEMKEQKNAFLFDNIHIRSLEDIVDAKEDVNAELIKEIMLSSLNLLDTLEKYNLGLLNFDLADFIIIRIAEGCKIYSPVCFFIGFEKLFHLKNKSIEIMVPFKKGTFLAPEVRNITALPAEIFNPNKASYYSVGLLAAFLTSNKKNLTTTEEFKDAVAPLLNTKVYWMILRCLKKEPSGRYLLFI